MEKDLITFPDYSKFPADGDPSDVYAEYTSEQLERMLYAIDKMEKERPEFMREETTLDEHCRPHFSDKLVQAMNALVK